MSNIFENWEYGPDAVMPSDTFVTSVLNAVVKLRCSDDDDDRKYPPLTIYSMMKRTCEANPGHLAHVTLMEDESVEGLTYGEYWSAAVRVAKSLIILGVDQTTCVISQGPNSSNYLVAALGTVFSGAVFTGVPAKNPPEYMEYPVKETHSRIIFVHDSSYVDKALQVQTLKFKHIIQMYGGLADSHKDLENVKLWSDLLELGNEVSDVAFEKRIKTIAPNKCALMCFTSGTTGVPKGCMHSHDNFTYTARCLFRDNLNLKMFSERIMSFFSYSHVVGQIIDLVVAICVGATVYFASRSETLFTNKIKIIKPTFLYGFPNIWMQIRELCEKDEAFDGLSSLRNAYIGSAFTPQELLGFFRDRNLALSKAYGTNEINFHLFAKANRDPINAVGNMNVNHGTKIGNEGELLANGRNVFMGYLQAENKNKASFDEETSWFHVGDLIKIDNDGSLYIIGRQSELIKTNAAVFIMPTFIENEIKTELSGIVSNCMLVGEGHDYLIALVTLKCKSNTDGEPTEALDDHVIAKLKQFGLDNISTPAQVSKLHPAHPFMLWFSHKLTLANTKSAIIAAINMENARIKKFKILPRDFSIENRELNALLKLCRNEVIANFKETIEECYK